MVLKKVIFTITLDGELKARVYARDGGCCQVCLMGEPPQMLVAFHVKRYDMTDPHEHEDMGNVALFCERCVLTISRYLGLMKHEIFIANQGSPNRIVEQLLSSSE